MFNLSPIHILLLLLIVVLIFGTKKLRNIGEDLGAAVKSFRKGMQDPAADEKPKLKADAADAQATDKPDSDSRN